MVCLVTGASGYVGGRLVPQLLADGRQVRCLVRNPEKLRDVPWRDQVEVVRGDLLREEDVAAACEGVEVVYYLVHSMAESGFAVLDRKAALIMGQVAREASVQRIVYLGGVHPPVEELSEHMASRAEVGEILLRSGVPTVVLQAAVIIGSGSASFEMLRHLTERLPVMVTPRWVHNRVQPIAVRDVVHYLVSASRVPRSINRSFDVGGPDVLTYGEMMRRYAVVAGLSPRRMLPVGVLTPWLSAQWINVVTPVPKKVGAPLIESLIHEAVCSESDIDEVVPRPAGGLTGYDRSVELALSKIRNAETETRWSDAAPADAPSEPLPSDPAWSGGTVYADVREKWSPVAPDRLWRVVEGVGGEHGWYSPWLLWAVRGALDKISGGVGLRRGRRHAQRLRVGEALDWWRVEELAEGRLLRLRAEMRLPGRAWLEFVIAPGEEGGSHYRQRAVFVPRGLTGHVYWWVLVPFHGLIFGGMARNVLRAASEQE